MKNLIRPSFAILVLLMAHCALLAQAPGNYVTNGGFEETAKRGAGVEGWIINGDASRQEVGKWHRFTAKFNSGDDTRVNFNFGVEFGSIGSIWVDNISAREIAIKNGSFEKELMAGQQNNWSVTNGEKTLSVITNDASEGHKALKITHVNEAVPRTSLVQSLDVKPHHDYEISYDVRIGDDFQGEARGLVFDASNSRCIVENYTDNLVSNLVDLRDRCGGQVILLRPDDGQPVEIVQDIKVPMKANLQADVDIENKAFQGEMRFVLEDPESGVVLDELKIAGMKQGWHALRTSLRSESAALRLRLIANGTGNLIVDNVWIDSPRIIPQPQNATWLSAERNLVIPEILNIYVVGAKTDVIDGGLELLQKDLDKYGTKLERSESADGALLKILIASEHAIEEKGNEAYALTINEGGIVIKAPADAGAFYGLMTVLQTIGEEAGHPVAVACEMTDYPDMPMRGILYGNTEQAARWKMNTLMYSTGMPGNAEEKGGVHQAMKDGRRLNMEFIPYFLTLYSGYYAQRINPNLAAGVWVQDEKIVMHGNEPSNLAHTCVIRTALTDIVLKSDDGRTTYEAGKDYQIIDGGMEYPYTRPAAPFAVARLEGSGIPDGAQVSASYDYVDPHRPPSSATSTSVVYCPVEPETQAIMAEFITTFTKEYGLSWIHPSHCLEEFANEEAQLATDSRVIKSGKRPIQLLAEDVQRIDRALKKGNPNARILQWAGHLNQYSRDAAPYLPKDALINIWNYDSNWPAKGGREALEFWSQAGFDTSVMSWTNIRNIRTWAQVVREMREKGYNCIGLINACWPQSPNPSGGMQESAEVSWRIPRKGERGYVDITAVTP